MQNILRDPGAEVIAGIASFAASFLGIGLALVALEHICLSYAAFGAAGLFLLVAAYSFIILQRHYSKTRWYIQQIGAYLGQGRRLRGELLSVHTIPEWTEELQGKVPHWKAEVQQWLDENLPEHALEFDVEGFLVDLDTGEGVNSNASRAAQHLEGRMSNLREILRDIRR
jgi:hypothetical protein